MPLALDRVTFAYPDGPTVLDHASLTIDPGSFVLVRGPSGAGKSTLLRLLCRLEEPQSGQILFHGHAIDSMLPATLRRTIAYVQQMPTLLSGTVRENLLLPFSFAANNALTLPDDAALNERLDSFLLKGVSLESRGNTLSVGQSQRICLIRSLLLNPEVVLMDEPTASLDAASARVVLAKSVELSRAGMTVIMISHSEIIPEGVTHIAQIVDRTLEYA